MSEIESIIGRSHVNDLNAILSIVGNEDEDWHRVPSSKEVEFTWDYQRSKPALVRLYEKAKTSQWNVTTDLDWSQDVDQEKVVRANNEMQASMGLAPDPQIFDGTPLALWNEKEWLTFAIESQNWMLSQFLHGEQGALICTAQIVETVPWIDAKYYAATQVVDEARHVEAFSRYLNEKLSGHYPINAHLGLLLDDIISDTRWDMTYLGMQIMVEGLALASFGFLRQMTTEPLLKELLRYVMSDEARHVAFGVLSLQDFYQELNNDEIRERQEFAFEAAVRMRDRFLQQEVWERLGVDAREVIPAIQRNPGRAMFQAALFSKIVPNCKKLGLLDAGDGWLRERFGELGVLAFEDATDTASDYAELDAVSGAV